MTSPVVSTVQYRTPRAFVQFIGESDEVYNLSPEHILSVQTTKSLGSPAGSFEIMFKGGSESNSTYSGPIDGRPATQDFDWWLKRLHPMTLAIIVLSSNEDVQIAQRVLNPTATPGTARPAAQVPRAFMASLGAPDRAALQRSVVMVGLVEECSLSVSMTSTGPQRALRVSGRDMGKLLLDDNLTRIARAQVTTRENETRMITVGDVSNDEWKRFMDRASINGQANALFWRTLTVLGSDSKLPLLETLTNIVKRAPSYNVRLSNQRTLQDYFDVGEVTAIQNGTVADYRSSRVVMSEELKMMSVRATMQLLTFSGPVYNALVTFAPPPFAEMFVETCGLEARFVVRRPPFYRPATMGGMLPSMVDYMEKVGRPRADREALNRAFLPFIGTVNDEFVTSDPQGRSGVRGICHTVDAFHVLSYTVSRSMANTVSIYQIYPTILMRGEASEGALQQGVYAYLYDLPAAQRYGTTKVYKFGCPWDVMTRQLALGTQQGARQVTRARDVRFDSKVGADVVWRPDAGSTEISLSAAETMRQYYYNRDNPGMLSGQIVVIGNPDYRVGDRVYLPDYDGLVFYVDAVQQSYQYGRSYVTTLVVSRGQPYHLDRRLVPYADGISPTLRMERQAAREPEKTPQQREAEARRAVGAPASPP